MIKVTAPPRRKRQEGNLAATSRGAWQRGKVPEEWNPMGVTGLKYGRAFGRGEIRREGEKPCGRNVLGVANRGGVDSPGLKRRRGDKLHESSRLEPVSREIGNVGGPNGLNPEEGATTGEELRSFGKAAGMSVENRKARRMIYQTPQSANRGRLTRRAIRRQAVSL
jgi:hypothetical protein